MSTAVDAGHFILRSGSRKLVSALRPDGMRFTIRLKKDVSPAPAAPIGTSKCIEAVVDQPKETGRIAFHNEHEARVEFAQRSLGANVLVEPLVGHDTGVGAVAVAVVDIAADSGPGGVGVVIRVRLAWVDDVEQLGKFAPDPRTGIVLVRD